MRRLLTFVMVMVSAAMMVAAGPEDGVKEAGAGWRQGAIKQDKALLQKYLADDLVYTHGGGQTETKAQYITDVTTGPSHYQSMTEKDVRIRFYGKTAVLWGLVDVQPAKGDLYRVRTLEVYTQNPAGVWQMSQKESVRVPLK
ncbi:MAG: nuclear transport factor 2 family protein [Vicinamibacterales bacterium]